jgi:hypothetical protein
MKNFTIENETNNIMVHGNAKDAEAIPNAQRFATEAQFGKLAADWPASRLVEIWNSLPGVSPISKFKDRNTAVSRIWKALQSLGTAEPQPQPDECQSESVETSAETVVPASDTTTDVAPQAAYVAPEEAVTIAGASQTEGAPAGPVSVDKDKCGRLLAIAATAQTGYWEALRSLEQAIGFELGDPGDLTNTSIDLLLERRATSSRRQTRRSSEAGAKAPRPNSKTDQVIGMLRREGGATLEEIMAAMGWQKHTTRAMLSAGGSLVKNHGLTIVSEKDGEHRRYSIKA